MARLDINHASAAEIAQAAGISGDDAQRIVDYRAEHPFFALEDLQEVPGMDGAIMAVLMDKVEFCPPRAGA